MPSQVFFAVLFGLTLEGFYSDPVYGGDEEVQAGVSTEQRQTVQRQTVQRQLADDA